MPLPPSYTKPNSPLNRQPAGSGFTNLQKILQANQQNKLGSTIAGGINQAGDAARSNIIKAGQEFETAANVEKQRQAGENQRVDRVLTAPEAAADEDVKAFETIRGGEYTGPKSLTNAGELANQAQNASQLGQAVGSEGGRQGLLQRFAGSGKKYTPGQQRLDALLLGQTGGNEQLRTARRSVSGLDNLQASKEQAASEVGKGLQGGVQGLKESAINRIGQSVSGYNTTLEEKAKQANMSREAYVAQAKENLKIGIADDKTIKALGLGEGARVWDADLGQFLNLDMANLATKQTAQSDQDYARINALSRLAGQSLQGDPSKYLEQFADKNLVGQFDKSNPYQNVNDRDVQAALLERENAYNAEIRPIMDPYNEAGRALRDVYAPAAVYQRPEQKQAFLDQLAKNEVRVDQATMNDNARLTPRMTAVYNQMQTDPDPAVQEAVRRNGGVANANMPIQYVKGTKYEKMLNDAAFESTMDNNAERNPDLWKQRMAATAVYSPTSVSSGNDAMTQVLRAYQQQDIQNQLTKQYINPAKQKFGFDRLLRKQ